MTGRPLKFETPEDLQAAINKYFASCCDAEGKFIKPVTITGLALALDTSRETLCEYGERPEFVDTVKRAKLRVEQFAEEQLYLLKNATGAIFALKNFGWKDSQSRELTGKDGGPIETSNTTAVAVTDLQGMSLDEITRLFTERLK